MIANGKENFFVAHYDWIAAGVGLVALIAAGAFYALAIGEDADEAGAAEAARIDRMKPAENGVKPVELAAFRDATRLTRSPVTIAEVPEKSASFLASERRVLCKCKKAISGDVKAVPVCPYCGEKQEVEKAVVLDADGDGLPDEWEKQYGLNPNSPSDAAGDADKDDFTNLEEYTAKTNPTDRNDHPDYLDSLKVTLPLKETYLSFVFRQAMKIPAGWRCTFFDTARESATDRRKKGATVTALVGEEIGNTGYIVKSYTPKTEKRARKGMAGKVDVDVSETVVERKSDKKLVTLVVQGGKGLKPVPVDVQASLAYERGAGKTLDVVPGQEIELSGSKYRITDIQRVGKGAKVTIENGLTGKKRVLEALEQ